MMSLPTDQGDDASGEGGGESTGLESFLVQVVGHLDQGEGVDFDTVLKNAVARGHVREKAESILDELLESGRLEEPRFGWFKVAQGN
jgi:hypothetical protein